MTEETNPESLPGEAVTTEPEINAIESETSQPDENSHTGDTEFVLDVEDDQLKTSKFDTSTDEYKAYKKANEAKKRKNALIQQMTIEREQMLNEVSTIKSELARLKKGEPPNIDNFVDEKDYEKAVREYYSAPLPSIESETAKTGTEPAGQKPRTVLPELVEFEHFQNEQRMKKQFDDYEISVQNLKDELHQSIQQNIRAEIPIEDVTNALINTGSMAKVDMSKAFFAISKIPKLKAQLINPQTLASDILIADVLREAEKAVKSTSKKSVSTNPTPTIRQGGPIDNQARAIENAREQWRKTGSAADFNKLRALKNGT